jgi:hypothetical protein
MKNSIKILLLISCFSFYNVNAMMESVEVFDGEEFTQAEKDAQAAEDAATEEQKKAEAAEEAAKTAAEKQSAQDLLDKAAADKAAADAQMAKVEAAITAAEKEVGTVGTGGGAEISFDAPSDGKSLSGDIDLGIDDDFVDVNDYDEVINAQEYDSDTYDPETGQVTDEDGFSYDLSEKARAALGDYPTQKAVDAALEETISANEKANRPKMQGLRDFFKAIGDAFKNLITMIQESIRSNNTVKAAFDEVTDLEGDQIDAVANNDGSTIEGARNMFELPEEFTADDLDNLIKNESIAKAQVESMLDQTEFANKVTEAFETLQRDLTARALPEGTAEVEIDEDVDDETPTAPAQPATSVNSGWGF